MMPVAAFVVEMRSKIVAVRVLVYWRQNQPARRDNCPAISSGVSFSQKDIRSRQKVLINDSWEDVHLEAVNNNPAK